MNIVAIPCIIAVPSIFMVAPRGTVKDETFFFTLKLFSKLFSVMGMVALLLEVEKANNKACFNPEKKFIMFTFAINFTNGR